MMRYEAIVGSLEAARDGQEGVVVAGVSSRGPFESAYCFHRHEVTCEWTMAMDNVGFLSLLAFTSDGHQG